MVMIDQINSLARDIIIRSPHYGLILSCINRHIGDKTKHGCSCPTAGVYKHGINMFMVINPEFWKTLKKEEMYFILLHELLHICFLHPTMGLLYADNELFNIAADMEINQHVMELDWTSMPGQGVTLAMFHMDSDEHRKKGTKYYYDYLKGEMKKPDSKTGQVASQACENMRNGKGDGHPTWKDFKNLSKSERRLIEGQAKRQIANAIKMNIKMIGNLPGTIKGFIEEILFPKPTYNWKTVFRRLYTGYADTTYIKKTRKKQSIRFPGMPGLKIKRHSRVLCAIDTSGSISKKELVEFFGEVDGMRKAGVQIIVVECDTRIPRPEGIYKYKNLEQIKNRELTGGGGTVFEEPIQYLNERANQFNMLIYLTDGYAAVPQTKSMKPIVWVLSRDGHSIEDFTKQGFPGFTIKIQDIEES